MVERIRALAKSMGMNISALEKAAGIGNGVIARWDEHSPRVSALFAVANVLGVSLDYLVNGEEKSA